MQTITPTASPWEFEWRCVCKRAGVISWAHKDKPPSFKAKAQGGLFDE